MTTPGGSGYALAETHTGVVIFAGDRAYKLKKPHDFGFVDLRTVEARGRVCHREVELNRRLAPDVYLGVMDVVDEAGAVHDHLVVMCRLRDDRRLSTLVVEQDAHEEVHAVARAMAAFHERAERSAAIDADGTRDAMARLWDDVLAGIATTGVVDAPRLDVVSAAAHRYLAGRAPLFAERIADGRIVDGHGDLLAADVFVLDDGPRILDCLEFDDRLRHVDVLSDVAFLAMDLERLGRPDLARAFLDDHRELTGDSWPSSLAEHHLAYRAMVRVLASVIRAQQGDPDAEARGDTLVSLAEDHLARGEVRLVLVGGLPGTGKSTLAAGLAPEIEAALLRTDEVREELVPKGEGRYEHAATRRVYDETSRRARIALGLGQSVVIDATWHGADMRAAAEKVARDAHATLTELVCSVPAPVARTRMAERAARATDPSEATAAVAHAMVDAGASWPGWTTVDTMQPPDAAIRFAIATVRAVSPRGAESVGRRHVR